jgi:hypothetical protein
MIITTQKIKGTLNPPTFYHSGETEAQLRESRFKQWNRLEKGVIYYFIGRGSQTQQRITQWMVILCTGISSKELIEELQLEHISVQKRLFIDSSKAS